MRKLVTICIALICYTDAFSAKLLDTYQLPLSASILKTFPKLKTKHFIIAVPRLGIVLHEENAKWSIRCGNFSEILDKMASLIQETPMPNIDQFLTQYGRPIPKYTDIASKKLGILISLYELCNLFEQEYLYIYRNHNNKRISNRLKLFAFYSGQNIGCICRYINSNKVAFDIIIYHEYDESTFLHDIEKIIQWLDRFLIKEVSGISRAINIPVFYGGQSLMVFKTPVGNELLIEKDRKEQVVRTIRYYMRLSAPITPSDKIGTVFYKYSLFRNPVKFEVYSNVCIQKSNIFKNLLDSICYIIYNRPWK